MTIPLNRFFSLLIWVFFGLGSISTLQSQSLMVNGYIRDKESGEYVIGSLVHIEKTNISTLTNHAGYFSIEVPVGTFVIRYQATGYMPRTDTIRAAELETETIEVWLERWSKYEIEVEGQVDIHYPTEETNPSFHRFPRHLVGDMPLLALEPDIIKAVQFLPGMMPAGEGSSSLHVRGGGNDQNLILIDGVPMYNVTHAFGFMSIFNMDAINEAHVYKGGFPARYGGRLASVIDITTRDGHHSRTTGGIDINPATGRFHITGPLSRSGKTTYFLSGRRSYIDLLLNSIADEESGINHVMYGLNGKLTHHIDENTRLSISLYQGRDRFDIKGVSRDTIPEPDSMGVVRMYVSDAFVSQQVRWGNRMGDIRLSKRVSKHLFTTHSLHYTHYGLHEASLFQINQNRSIDTTRLFLDRKLQTGLFDVALKGDYEYKRGPMHFIRFGWQYSYHFFNPGMLDLFFKVNNSVRLDAAYSFGSLVAHETALYVEDEIDFGNDWRMNTGLRLIGYRVQNTTYLRPEPRISLSKSMGKGWNIFSSYTVMNQFIHFISNSSVNLPTDIWVPATENMPPMKSRQISLGVKKRFSPKTEFTVDGYYKWMTGITDFREGQEMEEYYADWENRLLAGKGSAYGIEAMIQQHHGRWLGWVSGTISRSNRIIEGVNFGEQYVYDYDRPLYLTMVNQFKVNEEYMMGINVVYASGRPSNLPIGRYFDVNGKQVLEYGPRNSGRLDDVFRVDVSLSRRRLDDVDGAESRWTFSAFNVFARFNPVYARVDLSGNPKLVESTFFRFFPSVSYSLRF
jgi:hypothetical protein